MKRLACLVWGCILVQFVSAQTIDLKMLDNLLNLTQTKLEAHLQKKGFTKTGFLNNGLSFTKIKKEKSGDIVQNFQIITNELGYDLLYQTTSQQDYLDLENKMKNSGFYRSHIKTSETEFWLYQKKNLVVKCSSGLIDSLRSYIVCATKKPIPKAKDIVFAEDLLQLGSHEYLAEAFGRQNVKKDMFSFTPTESKPCTIIFPNTSHQAIFIWNDEQGLRDISFIIIGEQLNNNEKDVNAVMLSKWRSSQGVYCGMSLRELENLNKGPISFYNWRTETAGLLAPKNKGEINFEKLKPVFNCMNCNFLYVDTAIDIIQSNYSIEENQKVYVASFVLLPEKKIDITGQTSLK